MKYYKDNQNNVYAYELDGSQDHLIGDKVAMTAEEEYIHLNPAKTQEQLDAEAKQAKESALNSIKVTTLSGKVFDGRDKDQVRMIAALQASAITGITETPWKLADNTVAMVSLDELKEALAMSIMAVGEVIIGGVE